MDEKVRQLTFDELAEISGGRITFAPLMRTLQARGMTMGDLVRRGVITPAHVTRMRSDHDFTLKFAHHLCEYLGCGINDVIKYVDDGTDVVDLPNC